LLRRVQFLAFTMVMTESAAGAARSISSECDSARGLYAANGCTPGLFQKTIYLPAGPVEDPAAVDSTADLVPIGIATDAGRVEGSAFGTVRPAAGRSAVLRDSSGSPRDTSASAARGDHADLEARAITSEDSNNWSNSAAGKERARQAGSPGAAGVLALSLLGAICVRRRHA
jgi:hypothetical protein